MWQLYIPFVFPFSDAKGRKTWRAANVKGVGIVTIMIGQICNVDSTWGFVHCTNCLPAIAFPGKQLDKCELLRVFRSNPYWYSSIGHGQAVLQGPGSGVSSGLGRPTKQENKQTYMIHVTLVSSWNFGRFDVKNVRITTKINASIDVACLLGSHMGRGYSSMYEYRYMYL